MIQSGNAGNADPTASAGTTGGSSNVIMAATGASVVVNAEVLRPGNGGSGSVTGGNSITANSSGGAITIYADYVDSTAVGGGSTGATGYSFMMYCRTIGGVINVEANKIVTSANNSILVFIYGASNSNIQSTSTLSFRDAVLAGRLAYVFSSDLNIKGQYLSTTYTAFQSYTSSYVAGSGIVYLDGGLNTSGYASIVNVEINKVELLTDPSNLDLPYPSPPTELFLVLGNNQPIGFVARRGIGVSELNSLNVSITDLVTRGIYVNPFNFEEYRNDVGIAYVDDPYTAIQFDIDYVDVAPPPDTSTIYLVPAYQLNRLPVPNNDYNFPCMIRTKRTSFPGGNDSASSTSVIYFSGIGGSSAITAANSTLIEGEYVLNDPAAPGATLVTVIRMISQTAELYVKNIVLMNKNTSIGRSYVGNLITDTTPGVLAYGYSLSNVITTQNSVLRAGFIQSNDIR